MSLSQKDLRQVIVFQNATDDDLKLVLQNSLVRSIEEGGFFFFQGDSADHLYVLTHGQVKLMQAGPDGQQVNLRTIYPWEMFGALGAVHGAEARYPATAEALEDSSALAIQAAFFKEIMQTRPDLSTGLMQLMTSYIQEIQSRYRELATEHVEQRIARALLRLTSQSGQKANEGIELALSRQDLAEISGTTLYTVSRVLADWERQFLVGTGRERVRIINPHGLVKIAEGLDK
jgi:CRP/FNR family transcriptional regulator, nitrogen oxide reductase regulator